LGEHTVHIGATGQRKIQGGLIFTVKLLHRNDRFLPLGNQLHDKLKAQVVRVGVVVDFTQQKNPGVPAARLAVQALRMRDQRQA
jgi:hypothetical protein